MCVFDKSDGEIRISFGRIGMRIVNRKVFMNMSNS